MVVASRRCRPLVAGRLVRSPLDAVLLFAPLLSSLPRERVAVAYVSAERAVLRIATVAEGDDAAAMLPASEILRGALVGGAAGMILAHNHPSGDPTPSLADVRATRTLCAGAAVLGLSLVDHLVLARAQARSFRLLGLM